MSHEVFGERCVVRQTPAWHSLGLVIPGGDPISIRDAGKAVGIDYEVHKVRVPLLDGFNTLIDSGQYALVRGPSQGDQPEFLGFVGENYEVCDFPAIADILQPLANEWPFESIGALGKGERGFITLKVGSTVLNGSDRVDRYFLVNWNHANGKGVIIAVVTVRVVCANTLAMALDDASVVSFSHRPGIAGDLSVATSVIARLHQADNKTVRTLERLALARVTDDQVEAIIRAAFPDPTEPKKARFARQAKEQGQEDAAEHFKYSTDDWVRRVRQAEQNRGFAQQCYEKINREFEDIATTAWAAVNAVTEVTNHRPADKGNPDESVLFGPRGSESTRALEQAIKIADLVLA